MARGRRLANGGKYQMATKRIDRTRRSEGINPSTTSSGQTRFNTGRGQRSQTGNQIFSNTFEKTNVWLKDIAAELQTDDQHRAYVALRAVLQTLRDRLPLQEAIQLGSQLPLLVRGFYYEGWNALDLPIKYSRDEFVAQVSSYFENERAIDAVAVIRAVFTVLQRYISHGEMEDVFGSLPEAMRELFTLPEEQPVS